MWVNDAGVAIVGVGSVSSDQAEKTCVRRQVMLTVTVVDCIFADSGLSVQS